MFVPDTEERQCLACRRDPPPWARLVAPYRYEPPLDALVPRIKKVRGLLELSLLAELTGVAVRNDYEGRVLPQALIPIPMAWTRKFTRSFNHSEQLAARLARMLDLRVLRRGLRRTKGGPPQRRLTRSERLTNVRGAFQATRRIDGLQHIALIDDVLTTGATMTAATRALTKAGVERVDVWVTSYTPTDRLAAL